MVTAKSQPALIAIVGPTASGKSDLAMKIAKQFKGEIICADSRTIYKDMDVGTAKPSAKDRQAIRHWGLDLVQPGQSYSAAKFKKYAQKAIADIQGRGKLPVIVGGTGLYVDGLLYDFSFVRTYRIHRLVYSSWSINKLQKVLAQKDWPLPANLRNKRHLSRALERRGRRGSRRRQLPKNVLLLGLLPPDDVLKARIADRAQKMFNSGVIAETEGLLKRYGERRLKRTSGIIYLIIAEHLRGKISKSAAIEQFRTKDWQYARRQKTWFRRNPDIKWFSTPEAAYKFLKKQTLNT